MRLFLKRDISSDDSNYTVFDELGNEKYTAVFAKTKSAIKISILDKNGKIAAKIRKIPIAGATAFGIKTDNSRITFVTIISPKEIYCNFYGNNWHISGNLPSKSFGIFDVDNSIISSQEKSAGVITLDIKDPENELNCLAVSVCADFINTVDKLAMQAV